MTDKEYWEVYKQGKQKCKEVNNDCTKAYNPYKKGSEKWRVWNRGWNSF